MLRIIVLIVSMFAVAKTNNYCSEGYYWRDFKGKLTPDAFQGGNDSFNNPIYIAQAMHTGFLVPGKFIPATNTAYIEYGGREHQKRENIKILCTGQPHRFEWVETKANNIHLLTTKNLVIGGYEPGCTTYIGRARMDGQILVGKALTDNQPIYEGLYLTNNQKTKRFLQYEVLAFNEETDFVPGYYWRDFEGKLPPDAFQGGSDSFNNPIYIAQVMHTSISIPGKFFPGTNTTYVEYGGTEYQIRDHIIEWIETNTNNIRLIKTKNLVIGGYEPGCTTYIGRERMDGQILVGKALTDNLPIHEGLYLTNNEKTKRFFEYDVLAFNQETPPLSPAQ